VESLEWLDGCSVGYDEEPASALATHLDTPFWKDFLGRDFLHCAVAVDIKASDVAGALPQLKALTCLERVRVGADYDEKPVTDETGRCYVDARAELAREMKAGNVPLEYTRFVLTSDNWQDFSMSEGSDRRALQKRVADGDRLFVRSPNGSETAVTIEQFCEGTDEEIRRAVDGRARVKFRNEVIEDLRRELPGVQVDAIQGEFD
jgi:hypothetical protein